MNLISKNNLWVFIGNVSPLVKLMTNSYFVSVLLTSSLFLQGLQWRLISFMSGPDQTQVGQNDLISFTFMFTDFFEEYLTCLWDRISSAETASPV